MRIGLTVFSLTVALSSTQAFAQPINFLTSFGLCKLIKQDADRLKCFDGLQIDSKDQAGAPASRGMPNWEFSEKKSPLDDAAEITATLPASDASAALMLRCKDHKFEIFIGLLHTYLGTQNKVRVNFRVGDGKPYEGFWSPSTTGTGLFIPDPLKSVNTLMDNQTFFVRAFDYQGAPHDVSFSLQSVSDARDRVAKACVSSQPQRQSK